jgi:hypothetical protein
MSLDFIGDPAVAGECFPPTTRPHIIKQAGWEFLSFLGDL